MALFNYLANSLRRKKLVAFILVFSSAAFAGQNIDNIRLNANTISTVNTNGDLTFDLNGTGSLILTDLTASRVLVLDASKKASASSVTTTELGYLTGLSSAVQTQLDLKAPLASPTFSGTITTPLTASRALVTGASSQLAASAVTATELGYVSGVTGAVQTQIDGKISSTGTSGGIPYYSSGATTASSAALAANQIVLGGGAATTPATLGSLGTTTTVLHGNAAGAPTFGAVSLTADVSGTLPVANGGTGLASGTSGGVLAYTAAGTIASSAALTVNQFIKGGGAGAAPSTFAACSDGEIIKYSSGAPSCGSDSTGAGALVYVGKTSGFTAAFTENIYKLSSTGFTIALPTAVGNEGKGFTFVHGGTNFVEYVFDTASAQTINGVADLGYKLFTNGEVLTISSDGANWMVTDHLTDTPWTNFPSVAEGVLITAVTTSPEYGTVATNYAKWKRVKDEVEILWFYRQTATTGGTTGSGMYFFNLPAGITVDTAIHTANTSATAFGAFADSAVGDFHIYSGTGNFGKGTISVYDSTKLKVSNGWIATSGSANGGVWNSSNFDFLSNASLGFGLNAKFKVTGWQP